MAYYSNAARKASYPPAGSSFKKSGPQGAGGIKSRSWAKPEASKERLPRYVPQDGWNEQFQTVFDFVENGTGNGCIEAVAGSGKTASIVESIIRCSEKNPSHKILFVAFNVSIKEEGAKRLAGYNNVDVLTCHGLGYRSLKKAWAGKQFDVQDSSGPYMRGLVENELGPEKEKADDRDALMDLISKAKMTLTSGAQGMIKLMDRFNIETGYDRKEFVKYALKIMEFTKHRAGTTICQGKGGKTFVKAALTFDDEIWLPIVNDWAVDQYDEVFVDECQDLSKARRELVAKSVKDSGRIFIVGDICQAIFGFACADSNALPEMVEQFNCVSLPLSCSWRCDELIINEAQQFNPIITARPNAPAGIVDKCECKELLEKIEAGDVLISRTNAPLVRVFFQLAKQQRKVKFIGRDYGRMLSYRIKCWKRRHDVLVEKGEVCGLFTGQEVLNYNDEWLRHHSQNKKESDYKVAADRLRDEWETVVALTSDLDSALNSVKSVQEILDRCNVFSPEENKEDKDGKECITLSSTHRFKGLERPHVYVLVDTYAPRDANEEEAHLMYVAITRAKNWLTYVVGKPEASKKEEA